MIQRTLITNKAGEIDAFLDDIRKDEVYKRANDSLILFSDQNSEPAHLKERVCMIEKKVPKAKVVGITMPESHVTGVYNNREKLAGYSYISFDRSKIDIMVFKHGDISAEDAGRQLARRVRYLEHLAGILVFSSGYENDIDRFLTSVADGDRFDALIAGAQAEATGCPYVCVSQDDEKVLEKGIVVLILYGRGLHLYYNYDMGWRAIGKEMRVTGTDGRYIVSEIDGAPAVSIYKDYLGVLPDEYFSDNVREFPLVTYRGDRQVVRTPVKYDEKGRLYFIAGVNEGDVVRFSYGNPRRLLEDTKSYADSMQDFGPQALIMIICENRVRFLGRQVASDIGTYQSFMPEVAWVRGFAAVMMDDGGGGIANSAIVTIGMREGAPRADDLGRQVVLSDFKNKGAIPLDQRLAMFLEKTTRELEEMADAADVANAAKSEFLSQMSHEIRTPINAVLGMNEMILRDAQDENIRGYAESVRIAGMSLLGIISDILDFSKIEAGRMDIVPYEYELTSLINDVVKLVSHRVDEQGLNLIVSVDPDTPHMLFGDEIRIKQIITNLLTNAVKYTERGTITLSAGFDRVDADGIMLHVTVADTGIGIRPENIHRLFNSFDRIDNNRARQIEGTGLGLNITSKLLEFMGSKLMVESVYGEGSVFSFNIAQKVTDWDVIGDFNEAIKRISKRRNEKKTQFIAPGVRILVVDDAPMNLDVVTGLLKRTQMMVDTATIGRECLKKVALHRYDLVFLDHRMPGMDGIETLKNLFKQYGGRDKGAPPVIALTANAVQGAREEYIMNGFSDYLTKPVMADELEEILIKFIPQDEITYIAQDQETQEALVLPEWLDNINLLDTDMGIGYCGGVSEYIDALTIFAGSVNERAEELREALDSGDINRFTILIHALKTMTKSIGAVELSHLAESLEEAGKGEDHSAIAAGAAVFADLYTNLGEELKKLGEPVVNITTFGEENPELKHILLVDDDVDFVALISRWLKKEYKVSAIHSGEQALIYLQSERPDLVLLDYAMPGISGAEVLSKIRSGIETSDIPVIFLTGTEDREVVKNVERLRPEGYLLKSMGKSGLMMAVREFFGD
ncbi:MAG: response regulator [Eubacterium sp.]|nr:response regulator [Eubacterium sp.]